jgi:hypothetical protein
MTDKFSPDLQAYLCTECEAPLKEGYLHAPTCSRNPENHAQDSDCTLDQTTGCCTGCGVQHGDPCTDCGGRGFHKEDCPHFFESIGQDLHPDTDEHRAGCLSCMKAHDSKLPDTQSAPAPVITLSFRAWARIKLLLDASAKCKYEADAIATVALSILEQEPLPTTAVCPMCEEKPGTFDRGGYMVCGECSEVGEVVELPKPALTDSDWTEIYYALQYKLVTSPALKGVGKEPREWRAHLQRIIETIGPDGENMRGAGPGALLKDANVLDCGDAKGLRFQVWATALDANDTSRVASAFVCSTDTRENADMIARLINGGAA